MTVSQGFMLHWMLEVFQQNYRNVKDGVTALYASKDVLCSVWSNFIFNIPTQKQMTHMGWRRENPINQSVN